MLIMSPFLVIMVLFLLLTSYLYLMDLTKEELPSNFGTLDLSSGKFVIWIISFDTFAGYKIKWSYKITKNIGNIPF